MGEPCDDVERRLDDLAAQNLTVVEADAELSNYLRKDDFQRQLELMNLVAEASHLRGMRCVAYYPTLEVLTPNADRAPRRIAKDHPEWVQRSIDDKPNTFIGGRGAGHERVFWVDPGTESTWMCPTSSYLDYFSDRVNRLAATALDGVWGDVPLLSDIDKEGGYWPCTNVTCKDRFKRDTGRDTPTGRNSVDWNNETFRVWVNWRHKILWEFEQEVWRRAKAVRKDFEIIIETVTMDYNSGTGQGLDGAFRDDGGVYRVWEVDAVSDGTSMRHASENDWISMAVMMRHGACASRPRPSWVFTYGLEEDDAEPVMGLAIATGNSPYETKIPAMCTTVGHGHYRARMFAWMAQNRWVDDAEGTNAAAVLFSPSSRDYLDQAKGVGLYTSRNDKDTLWWAKEEASLAQNLEYVGDYRGIQKCLIHAHVPYDILPASRLRAASTGRYKLLAVPSAVALEEAQVATLMGFVEAGGTLVVTGMDGGTFRETGEKRGGPLLVETIGIPPGTIGFTTRSRGKGKIVHAAERVGQAFLASAPAPIFDEIAKVAASVGVTIETNAPRAVIFDLRRAKDGRVAFFAVNLDGLGVNGVGPTAFTPRPAKFDVSIPVGDKVPRKVTVSTPASQVPVPIPFTRDAARNRVNITLSVTFIALVAVD